MPEAKLLIFRLQPGFGGFYQSVGQVKKSLAITISRGILLVPLFLWILPPWLGVNGIWLSLPAAESVTALGIWGINRWQRPILVK